MKELDAQGFSDLSSDEDCESDLDLVVIPPDPDVLTDEECIDDDVLGDHLPTPKDVSGEIEIFSSKSCKTESDVINTDKKSLKTSQKMKKRITWRNCSPEYNMMNVDTENIEKAKKEEIIEKLLDQEPVDVFLQLFNDSLLEHITQESIKYAQQKNHQNFTLTVPMLKRFIGFLLYSGYVCLPLERLYWSLSEDASCPLVRTAMSRSTYTFIKQNLHLADNNALDKSDKLSKVRPYLNILNTNFMQYGVFSTNLSVDEQMIIYFGRHSCKMFLKGKPVRFGYKVWCLCSSGGIYTILISIQGNQKTN